ncbi:MAG: ADP-ribosylglycohydrolase family protein [Selenomonadaceae bacterium]|nr:ADP-ribosylglycohydrolase family protein [Selenomonadaceae bacterium]MBR1730737.1 ADP-ribosylglycohydrolase family protein [Selenomonadaceae bacterium]
MYGAILGDIIGSVYERDSIKKKDFPLFSKESRFTDDTMMTIAVADALINVTKNTDKREIKSEVIRSMRFWGNKSPNAGYGHAFRKWLKSDDPKPYKSYGNGSAMRVSPVGWLYDDLYRTREVARWTAEVTHNHSEGVKGAESVASAIFLARNGKSKDEIKNYIEENFSYDLSRSLDEIRKTYEFEVSCQKSVPESIIAFLESNDFEDAIRNAISLGGDADTQAAIAGSIAEAFYGVSDELKTEVRNRLNESLINVLDRFQRLIKNEKLPNTDYEDYKISLIQMETCCRI